MAPTAPTLNSDGVITINDLHLLSAGGKFFAFAMSLALPPFRERASTSGASRESRQ